MGTVRGASAAAGSLGSLIEAFEPGSRVPSAPAVLQARRNAVAREEFLAKRGAFEVREAVLLAGYKTSNPSEQAGRWIDGGKAFAVEFGGRKLFPAFQFDPKSGQLRREVEALLGVFRGNQEGWEIALWMTSPNGWLGGARPIDLWPGKLDRVLEAARREVAPLGS